MNLARDKEFIDAIKIIESELMICLAALKAESLESLAFQLRQAKRLFFAGEGRSGLVAKMSAMRMMHLGKQSFVVGETTTPPIKRDDLLIIISGSGNTPVMKLLATTAKENATSLAVITTDASSELAKSADLLIRINAQSKTDISKNSKQFAGSLFEQTALLSLDAVFYVLSKRESYAALMQRHTNLE